MKRMAIIFAISATVLLSGCGGAPKPAVTATATPTPTPSIAGNWQLNAASAVPGTPPIAIGGSINQDGTVVSGAVHVNGSKCVDPMIAMSLTGSLNGESASLTATGMDGQAVTFSGNFIGGGFNGTYTIKGSCVTGDQGTLTGSIVPDFDNVWTGTFTNSAQKSFKVLFADMTQSASASSQGSFEITGTATFDTPCFSSGNIKPGTFPTGSFILGTSVALEFETSNGTLVFLGTEDINSGEISGNYTLSGGTCTDNGTGVLDLQDPWDYFP